MKPNYYVQTLGRKRKYFVSYHDGTKTHKDGSPFYDMKILTNKKDTAAFVNNLTKNGYVPTTSGIVST